MAHCQERLISVGLSRFAMELNSHKVPHICGRATSDEKIDQNLILKAPSFYENTCITVRREYCDSDSTISNTFSVRVWRNEVCRTVPPDFQTLAASSVRSWDASRFPVVRKTAGLATFGRSDPNKRRLNFDVKSKSRSWGTLGVIAIVHFRRLRAYQIALHGWWDRKKLSFMDNQLHQSKI